MGVVLRASTGNGAVLGSVSVDEVDFQRLEQLLGLESWVVLGVSYMLHPNHAAAATGLVTCEGWARLWAIERAGSGAPVELDQIVRRGTVLEVTEFTVDGRDVEQPDYSNVAAVMLHSAKRTSIVMWRSIVYSRAMASTDFDVIDTRRLVWDHDRYIEMASR